MLDLCVRDPIKGVRLLPFLPGASLGDRLFQGIAPEAYEGLLRPVSLERAYAMLLPHEYVYLRKHPSYLKAALAEAKAAGKRVLCFAYQDDPAPIRLPGSIVFRPSAYASALLPNEVMMPAYVEDMGALYGHAPNAALGAPIVGFVGKAGLSGPKEALRHALRDYALAVGAKRSGLYFRRRGLSILTKSPDVTLNAIVRSSFSAHRKTLEAPLEEVRASYVANMRASQYIFAPRGDGNYSLRFFEALSMGRIPVLLDTDMRLPLENEMPYDAFIVRVPWQDLRRLPKAIAAFHAQGPEALMRAQEAARQAFADRLYMPKFLAHALRPAFLDAIPHV
jgi:hypothetical protein